MNAQEVYKEISYLLYCLLYGINCKVKQNIFLLMFLLTNLGMKGKQKSRVVTYPAALQDR